MWCYPVVTPSITHGTSRSAKLIKNPSSLITKVEKSWQDFLLSEGGGGKAICTVSAFCCHIDPENTRFSLRALWTWWLKHVMERGKEQDPGLHGEPADESRRVRTKPLE